MNSWSPALHSPISCPQCPPHQRLEPSLHSTTFALSISASQQQPLSVCVTPPPPPPPPKKKTKQEKQQQQWESKVKCRLPLFDIYKCLSEMHDAHPCECVHTV